MKEIKIFDVIIIGGSYAGLSAAMALGRSLRNVLIIDSGTPCNRQTPHSHNFLTQDGKTPLEVSTLAKQQVLQYKTVQFHNDLATSGRAVNGRYEIQTASGGNFSAKKLIFATGIKDLLPDIRGFAECWGISVIHCPYCHGYEFRGQRTGLMANGDRAMHVASLVNNLTDDLCMLTSGKADFNAEQLSKLKQHHIDVIETEITNIIHENGYIKNVVFKDGTTQSFDAVYAAIPFTQHSDIPASLGCEFTEHGHIQIDHLHKTTVEGVYACGDSTTTMRSIASAVNTGNMTGAMVNMELTHERF